MDIHSFCGSCDKKGCEKCYKAMVDGIHNMLKHIVFKDTDIGELARTYIESTLEPDLICSGMQIYGHEHTGRILRPINENSFKEMSLYQIGDKTPIELLEEVKGKEGYSEHVDQLKDILRYKLVAYPIQVGDKCNAYRESTEHGKGRRAECYVQSVKWNIDRESNRLGISVIFERKDKDRKERCKFAIEEYGKSLFLARMDMLVRNKACLVKCIEYTPEGFVRPVVFVGKHEAIAIDNTRLYKILPTSVTVVDKIMNIYTKDNLVNNKITEFEGYSKIADSLGYVQQHRAQMAPFGLVDSCIVKL